MRVRRGWRWFFSGLVLALVAAGALLATLSQTGWGQRRVLRVTLGAVGGNIQGQLTVERLAGNLLVGARLYGISIRGSDGEPFLEADSAFAEYRLPTLLGTQLAIRRLVLYGPRVEIRQLPGDTLWNYQRIFTDTLSTDTVSERTTSIDRLDFVGGTVRVMYAWEPETEQPGAARQAEIREALSDSSLLVVQRVPGGLLRTMRFTDLHGTLSEAFFPSPVGRGSYFRVDSLAGRMFIYRDPLVIRRAQGEIAIRDSVMELRVPDVILPRSRLSLQGVVLIAEDNPVDLTLRSDTFALADLQWLYPRLPAEGGGASTLRWQTRPDGTLFLARDLRLSMPGTRIRGSFGLVVGDTLRFTDVDLVADPLRTETVERLLPEGLPVRGLRIGSVEVRGPDG
ncbi:MAG: hypothetical protein M3409_05370 [Gemmatimonadota bacterium]|jgi:hypothetical protein|nr:hypothetical protein [Gemmatimonadota bacterium]